MLTGSRLSVSEVTEQVGYINQSKFAAAFKKQFGISPLEYRRRRHLERLSMRNFDGQNTQISQDFTASNLPGSKNQCYNIREVVSVELNFEGVVVGVMSLVIIGAFHPLVIWFEYHFTQSIWPVF